MPAKARVVLVLAGLALAGCRADTETSRAPFERRGVQTPCEPLAVRVEAVAPQRSLRLPGTRREAAPALVTIVQCRYEVPGRTLVEEFRVPYDWAREVRQLGEQLHLLEELGPQGLVPPEAVAEGARQVQKLKRSYEAQVRSLKTVTYLPEDPRRAVLGPVDRWFSEAPP